MIFQAKDRDVGRKKPKGERLSTGAGSPGPAVGNVLPFGGEGVHL